MRKIISVQYLRAIAALCVVASHALLYPLSDNTMFGDRLGWIGVILFFVVSGFIMVSVTGHNRFDPIKFMRRRILRIVPLYWAFTFFAALMAIFAPQLFKTTVFDLGQLLLSLFFIPFYNAASHGFHPLYKLGWTLNYEMFFYLCFALLAFLPARPRVWVLTIVYALFAAYGLIMQPQTAFPAFYTSFMPLAFVLGAWIGLWHIEGSLVRLKASWVWPLLAVSAIGLVIGFAIDRGYYVDPLAFVPLVSAAVIVLALAVRFEAQIPHLPVLEFLGDASYSIYLAHILAVGGMEKLILSLLGADNLLITGFAMLAALVGGTLLGVAVYLLVEKPLTQALKRFA